MREYFLRPICRVEAESETEATDKIFETLVNAGIEIRGWAKEE